MGKAFNELTLGEAERLALLLEELGEAQQIIGKILRHGYESYNPFDKTKTTNRELLERELGDVRTACLLMYRACDISLSDVVGRSAEKLKRVGMYLHHNKVKGVTSDETKEKAT